MKRKRPVRLGAKSLSIPNKHMRVQQSTDLWKDWIVCRHKCWTAMWLVEESSAQVKDREYMAERLSLQQQPHDPHSPTVRKRMGCGCGCGGDVGSCPLFPWALTYSSQLPTYCLLLFFLSLFLNPGIHTHVSFLLRVVWIPRKRKRNKILM